MLAQFTFELCVVA